jgi:hypothetical protein
LALLAWPNASQAGSDSLEGDWTGSGFVKPNTGEKERVLCKISYDKESSNTYSVRADCASTDKRILQTGSILQVRDNSFVGNFHNAEYNVSGRIRIVVNGSRQTLTLQSDRGTGSLRLRKDR